jgi:DNA-binding CsgD family transcriptional regulator
VSGARRRETTGWGSLSPTESKVAGVIAEGMSNPQIADRMFLSKRTTETHVSHIFGRLGLRSRVEIAREASRHAGAEPEPTAADGQGCPVDLRRRPRRPDADRMAQPPRAEGWHCRRRRYKTSVGSSSALPDRRLDAMGIHQDPRDTP